MISFLFCFFQVLKLKHHFKKPKNKSARGKGSKGKSEDNNSEEVNIKEEVEDEDLTDNGLGEEDAALDNAEILLKDQSKHYDKPEIVQLYAVTNQRKDKGFDVVVVVREKYYNLAVVKSKAQHNPSSKIRVMRYCGKTGHYRSNFYIS